jgi:2-polyprenyl-3-methyl-5-hydroxy-6-metoxy-1,4-benzoquinol methylase
MSIKQEQKYNDDAYNLWSECYDNYPNPTVAVDELYFPEYWNRCSNKKILEIGCGTGRHTQKLVRNNIVTAIDRSSGMIAIAKKKIISDKVRFSEIDFLALDDKENDYDIIIESLVLEHVPNLESFFCKAAVHLKEGGDLYLSEIHPSRAEKGIGAHFKKYGSEEEVHLISYLHSEAAIIHFASLAGMVLSESEDIYGDEVLAGINKKWSRYQGMPMIKIWHFLR